MKYFHSRFRRYNLLNTLTNNGADANTNANADSNVVVTAIVVPELKVKRTEKKLALNYKILKTGLIMQTSICLGLSV